VLAEEMDRTPPEVMKKLENLKNKILWTTNKLHFLIN
jgi:hypothetical protein